MADPNAIVPYNDPFDSPYTDDIFSFDDDYYPNPNFAHLSSLAEEPGSCPASFPQNGDGNIGDPIDPLEDLILWEMGNNNSNFMNNQAGPSEIRGETSNNEEGINAQPQNFGFGNTMGLSFWPVPAVPFLCSCCQVLREIIHTKGNHTAKLEIHGRLGMICHAVLDDRQSVDAVHPGQKYQMFDFCKKSIENVKEFLMRYCDERKQAGYIMLQDPLSIFYEALCVGLEWDENLNTDDFFEPYPRDSGAHQRNRPEAQNHEERIPKSSLAAQRERTGKLTLRDLVQYFHLPIDDAAKQLNICPTVVKKICRRYGLNRWPHRKIKSIERKIRMLRVSLDTADVEERARIQAEIERLQQVLANICGGVSR